MQVKLLFLLLLMMMFGYLHLVIYQNSQKFQVAVQLDIYVVGRKNFKQEKQKIRDSERCVQ